MKGIKLPINVDESPKSKTDWVRLVLLNSSQELTQKLGTDNAVAFFGAKRFKIFSGQKIGEIVLNMKSRSLLRDFVHESIHASTYYVYNCYAYNQRRKKFKNISSNNINSWMEESLAACGDTIFHQGYKVLKKRKLI